MQLCADGKIIIQKVKFCFTDGLLTHTVAYDINTVTRSIFALALGINGDIFILSRCFTLQITHISLSHDKQRRLSIVIRLCTKGYGRRGKGELVHGSLFITGKLSQICV